MTVAKSILLIGNTKNRSVERLLSEAKSMGVVLDVIHPKFFLSDGDKVSISKDISIDIWSYDTYFFRGIGEVTPELKIFLNELSKKGKRIVENYLKLYGQLPEDKLVLNSETASYRVPKSQIIKASEIDEASQPLTFPLVVKKLGSGSSQGKMVSLVNNFSELKSFSSSISGSLLIQEYYPLVFDTRVMVIDGKCIGGFNRFKSSDNNFLTTARGGKREVVQLTDRQCSAAIEATRLQGLEISGVDMFSSEGIIYVIEVNCSPQFRVFERCTGVNVAKEIISYLTK